ncbi:MAG: response regulator [Dorea sp.]|nr:response regulator [Dorea sp.]
MARRICNLLKCIAGKKGVEDWTAMIYGFEEKKQTVTKKGAGLWFLMVIGILIIVVVLSTWWLLKSSQTTTEASVYNVSKLYLEELTAQQTKKFTNTLDNQTQQLKTAVHLLGETDVSTQEAMQKYIAHMEEINGFDFFALVDEEGTIYTESSVYPGVFEHRFPEGGFTEPYVSFNKSMGEGDLVLVSIPLGGYQTEGHQLAAATVGIDTETVIAKMSLDKNDGHSFSNVVKPDGSYVIRMPHTHLAPNTNLFTALEEAAYFEDDTAFVQWQEAVEHGREGMAVYELMGLQHFTYYMPIHGTDWSITTTLHYSLVSGNVDIIRTTLARNSGIQLLLVLMVVGVLFVVYLSMHKKNDSLHFEKIQAEEGSKAKSAFLSNMSHDIRTPMNAIIGFANLAVKNVEDTEKTRDYLVKILTSGNHLLALINDVLEMSRIESGKIHLEEAECNLFEMLKELYGMIYGQAEEKELNLVFDAGEVTDGDVYCDKLRMNQMFLNLLGNAVKFTPKGGEISVRISQKDAVNGRGTYVIRIKDTGIGMAPEFARKVFVPFERERTSTVSGIQGTGLGMSITKNIVDLMDGTIDVVTETGKGTEFIVTVELRLQEKQSHQEYIEFMEPVTEPEADSVDFTGKRILVVEDNELNREIAVEVLEESGFKTEEAQDGSIAVEKVRASVPGYYDLVLMDIQMPVMDGYEASRAIRALEDVRLASVPIVAMTANAFEEDKQAALDAGMNGHLAKPFDVDELFEMLASVINR